MDQGRGYTVRVCPARKGRFRMADDRAQDTRAWFPRALSHSGIDPWSSVFEIPRENLGDRLSVLNERFTVGEGNPRLGKGLGGELGELAEQEVAAPVLVFDGIEGGKVGDAEVVGQQRVRLVDTQFDE